MMPPARIPTDVSDIVAVVDTNVLVEVHSVHDVLGARPGTEEKRWANARNSLLLAIHFHQTRAITYSIREIADVMRARVPPSVRTREGLFATLVAHFVKDWVLDGWDSRAWPDGNPRSNAADRHLIDRAEVFARPLITRERRMTAKALKRGVAVYSPEGFWQRRGLDVERSARRFLARFKALAPSYVRDTDPADAEQRRLRTRYLREMYDFYALLLG